MTVGEKFREIRRQRKYTIAELGLIAGSKSSISAFENNKSCITIDTLLRYMDELVITPEEFFDSSLYLQNDEIVNIMQESLSAFQMNDSSTLLANSKKVELLFDNTNRYIYHIISLNLHLLAAEIDASQLDNTKKQEMIDYFFSLQMWTILDIGLWGNVANHYNDQTIYLLSIEIAKEISEHPQSGKERICIDTILNSLYTLLSHHNQEYSQNIIKMLSSYIFPDHYMYQTAYLKFCIILYKYLWEDSKAAIKEKEKMLIAIGCIFSEREACFWETDFNSIIKDISYSEKNNN